MFFDGLDDLVRVLIVGAFAYAGLIALLRLSGKRTLAQMNAFDLIVTVALGSTLATVLLSRDVSLSEGLLALALLVGLQFAIAWLAVRYPATEKLTKSEPTLLLFRGEYLGEAMRDQRITESEVLAALRESGLARREDAFAVILETNGKLSVTSSPGGPGEATALQYVDRAQAARRDAVDGESRRK